MSSEREFWYLSLISLIAFSYFCRSGICSAIVMAGSLFLINLATCVSSLLCLLFAIERSPNIKRRLFSPSSFHEVLPGGILSCSPSKRATRAPKRPRRSYERWKCKDFINGKIKIERRYKYMKVKGLTETHKKVCAVHRRGKNEDGNKNVREHWSSARVALAWT